MNLEQFVKKHKTQVAAAKALGLSQGMISHRLSGRYKMTANAAIDLERRSGGEISRYDLLPNIFGTPDDQDTAA
ncbi:transcriptional regulator [Methylobacter marinus]|jgi:DNA-binding transcriptional regulator YdaS (Cro superfamily)|uniref:transcriptional regulator n=1 Tax=Methylobacter marinus TaxID=34058 RepID=UPI000A04CEF4|nr:YdaS family helix-turn-helix protein [Methylobacter marinus]